MSSRPRRRLVLVLLSLPVLLATTALTYMLAMRLFEGQERGFWAALEWAAETLTTTGYGRDARWRHPLMVTLVVTTQFVGVFLVYVLVPLLLLPYIEERFQTKLPRAATGNLRDHIVIVRWGPAVETLLEELVDAEIEVALIELDEAEARSIFDLCQADRKRYRGVHLVHERTLDQALDAVRLGHARAIIANGSDEENATAALVAREQGFEGEILALVEEAYHRSPLHSAGATAVYTPRHVLGAALAARASHRIQPRVGGIQQLSENLRVAEIRIDPESFLAGKTLRETDLGAETGATILGQWVDGTLDSHPTPSTRLVPRGILLAIGRPASLDRLSQMAADGQGLRSDGHFVVGGWGEVGRKVTQLLRDVGEEVRVVDAAERLRDEVDVCGDITDAQTLEALDLPKARAVVLALDSDGAALFSTLIIRDEAKDLPIVARVNHAQNIDRLHRAGADFALSISQVSAQILAHRLLRRDSLALGTDLEILKVDPAKLVDEHPSTLEIRKRTGCSVVAVERGENVLTRFEADFVFRPEDVVYVCGHRSDIERFTSLYT